MTIARLADVAEFMPAAFDDLVIKHLCSQRDALVKALEDARNELHMLGDPHEELIWRINGLLGPITEHAPSPQENADG